MNNLFKISLVGFVFFSTGLFARHGFGGGFAGGMVGSMLGSAMTAPRRTSTVIVEKGSGGVERREVNALEDRIRDSFYRLEEVVRKDLNTLNDKLRELESENKDLKKKIEKLEKKVVKLEKK